MHSRSKTVVALQMLVAILALSFPGFLRAQDAHYKKDGDALLPDPAVTPGKVAITSQTKVCTTKWDKDERHVTQTMKNKVFASYGTAPGQGVCVKKSRKTPSGGSVVEGCEIDHLISRELGGADDVENLWPQPYTQDPGAHQKDKLENKLHKEVCSGKITLQQAQDTIKTDWFTAYKERYPTP
jgi:hypothetical protein